MSMKIRICLYRLIPKQRIILPNKHNNLNNSTDITFLCSICNKEEKDKLHTILHNNLSNCYSCTRILKNSEKENLILKHRELDNSEHFKKSLYKFICLDKLISPHIDSIFTSTTIIVFKCNNCDEKVTKQLCRLQENFPYCEKCTPIKIK